jgi:phosphate transport system permease protein
MGLMWLAAGFALLVTAAIVVSVLREALLFFQHVPFADFLFGSVWSPQTAMRADQSGASGMFGVLPLLAGTFLVTLIALLVAVPVGLMSAIYLAEYASPRMRRNVKPMLELLAGIPTVVYGYFAVISVAPFMHTLGKSLGVPIASESALVAGMVMGVMIIPFVSSLSDDMLTAVPRGLRDAS